MRAGSTTRTGRAEKGIALLISIFILLLISVVAIALVVSSGTESALAGNYRSSTAVYYAALAGLEEGRGRLLAKNPNSFKNTTSPTFMPIPGPLAIGQVRYILNPGPSENAGTLLTTYPDSEYANEFGAAPAPGNVQTVATVSTVGGIQGPSYKWVRLNGVTEQSLNLDVSPYGNTPLDNSTPVYYDGSVLNDNNSGAQVIEVTSLAVLPNGSTKLLQYLAAPALVNLNFPSALTLNGNNVAFNTTTSPNFIVAGIDQYGTGSCTPGAPPITALGYTNGSDSSYTNIVSAIPSGPPPNPDLRNRYTNGTPLIPDVSQVTFTPNLTTVAGLNSLVQTIKQNVDVPVMSGMGVLSDANNFMPSGMSATNPMTIMVDDDLTFSGWHHHGYGLLLVTGELTYDPDAFWHGIVLVIGKGWFHSSQGSFTGGHIEGELFIAKTKDSLGNPLPIGSPLGPSQFDFTGTALTPSGSNYYGVFYSNCWIQAAMPSLSYRILSFREISQ